MTALALAHNASILAQLAHLLKRFIAWLRHDDDDSDHDVEEKSW